MRTRWLTEATPATPSMRFARRRPASDSGEATCSGLRCRSGSPISGRNSWTRLGYSRYGLQGGDSGAVVSAARPTPSDLCDRPACQLLRRVARGRGDGGSHRARATGARRLGSSSRMGRGTSTEQQATRPQTLGTRPPALPAGTARVSSRSFGLESDHDARSNQRRLQRPDARNIVTLLNWLTASATSPPPAPPGRRIDCAGRMAPRQGVAGAPSRSRRRNPSSPKIAGRPGAGASSTLATSASTRRWSAEVISRRSNNPGRSLTRCAGRSRLWPESAWSSTSERVNDARGKDWPYVRPILNLKRASHCRWRRSSPLRLVPTTSWSRLRQADLSHSPALRVRGDAPIDCPPSSGTKAQARWSGRTLGVRGFGQAIASLASRVPACGVLSRASAQRTCASASARLDRSRARRATMGRSPPPSAGSARSPTQWSRTRIRSVPSRPIFRSSSLRSSAALS